MTSVHPFVYLFVQVGQVWADERGREWRVTYVGKKATLNALDDPECKKRVPPQRLLGNPYWRMVSKGRT